MGRRVIKEVIEFVKDVPPDLIRKMERGEIDFSREFFEEAGRRNLLGLKLPREYCGRGLNWVIESTAIEEVGVLGVYISLSI